MGKYVYNSSLKFVKANFNGNRLNDERFTNYPYPDPEPTLKKVLKWRFSTNPQQQEKKQDTFKLSPQFLTELPQAPDRYLIWLGHASFFIKLGDLKILTDPITGGLPFVSRKAVFPLAVDELKGLDYILISHAHRDHFDSKSLNKILKNNPGVEILGPLRLSSLVAKLASQPPLQEAGWYQEFNTKQNSRIVFLPAIHWHRRGLLDFNKVLWGSFYVSDGEKSIYFAGDTSYNKHFKSIAETIGSPDICLLPIGAYKPQYLMKASHMSPEEAMKAYEQLGGSTMIPMHYGTFDLADEPLGEPLRLLDKMADDKDVQQQVKTLQPGEIYPF